MDDGFQDDTPVKNFQFVETINQINETLKQIIANQNALMKQQYDDTAMRPRFEKIEREVQQLRTAVDEIRRHGQKEEYDQNNVENDNRNQENAIRNLENKIRNLENKIR